MLQHHTFTAPLKCALPLFLGACFAAGLCLLWNLQGRWFYIAIAGLFLVSVSMIFASRFADFLFIFFLFAVPLAGFTKWLFIRHYPELVFQAAPLSGAIGIGLTDFLIVGLYLSWFARIFITREQPLPRFQRMDWLILALIGINVMSLPGTLDLKLGVYAVAHLVKHVLVYFYVSRNFRRSHIPWFIAAVFCAIVLESAVGATQYHTGKLRGLMLDKGTGSERLDYQYTVPGIEGLSRATGTSYDSHSLGLYLAMLLPYPFVFLPYSRYVSWSKRIVSGGVFLLGVATLLITFSRSGWLSAALALCLALLVLLAWHGRHAVASTLVLLGLSLLPLPWAAGRIHERFTTAPPEIMTARFDQFSVAWHMWRDHPFFGFGAGNYMKALDLYNTNGSLDLPVHNVFLWIAADTGLLGVLAFYGIIVSALRRLWILIRRHHDPDCRLALAVATGLVAYVLDGLTNPLFREATVYMMFWLLIAMSVVLPRLQKEARNGLATDDIPRGLLVRAS